MYPSVLPIVFYDGGGEWAAETNFFNKVENNAVFAKFIPSFEYLLVNLTDYDESTLAEFGDALSFALIIDKMRIPNFKALAEKLPEGYWENVNLPMETRKALSDFVTLLLTRINTPKEKIEMITDYIAKKEVNDMLSLLEDIDIQAEWKRSAEALEALEAAEARKKAAEAERDTVKAERDAVKAERDAVKDALKTAVSSAARLSEDLKESRRGGISLAMRLGASVEDISRAYNISAEEVMRLSDDI
jgi:hypothetical protein